MIKKLSGVLSVALLTLVLSNVLISQAHAAPIGDEQSVSTCVSFNNNLNYRKTDAGTNGEVSVLQDFLITNGYLDGSTTGFFGLKTVAAVKKFQIANNISATGTVGATTGGKIKAMTCAGESGSVSANPVMPSAPTIPSVSQQSSAVTDALQSQINVLLQQIAELKAGQGQTTTTISAATPAAGLSAGCTSTVGFSPTTGLSCSVSASAATPSPIPAAIVPPTIIVTSPNGGESYGNGQTANITWKAIFLRRNYVDILFSGYDQNGNPVKGSIYGCPNCTQFFVTTNSVDSNSGSFSWSPADAVNKVSWQSIPAKFKITVTEMAGAKDSDPRASDDSDGYFYINASSASRSQPSITVTSPNGGEAYVRGQTISIGWSGGNTAWPIYISLINSDRTKTYQTIVDKAPYNGGSYMWTIPTTVDPGEYSIYVEGDRGDPNGYPQPYGSSWDYSDKNFTISGTTQ